MYRALEGKPKYLLTRDLTEFSSFPIFSPSKTQNEIEEKPHSALITHSILSLFFCIVPYQPVVVYCSLNEKAFFICFFKLKSRI